MQSCRHSFTLQYSGASSRLRGFLRRRQSDPLFTDGADHADRVTSVAFHKDQLIYVSQGIKLTIDCIRKYQPQTRIILMAIFPRERSPADPLRAKVKATNQLLAAAARTWGVTLIDIGSRLLEEDGSISKETMGDFVHLTPKGYRVWADAVLAALKQDKV
jgi:hypothetical protein